MLRIGLEKTGVKRSRVDVSRRANMHLRAHPEMIWRGKDRWPPVWNGPSGELLIGEEGILRDIELIEDNPIAPVLVRLVMECEGKEYSGVIPLHDGNFAFLLYEKAKACRGLPLSDIGNLEIDFYQA